MLHKFCISIGFALLVGVAAPASFAEVNLPDIGSSAEQIISEEDFEAYGAESYRQMRLYGLILTDPLVEEYLHSMAFQLVAQSNQPEMNYRFFVVKNQSMNAFASPGGYIGINAGLILKADNESEIAAVVAHEIAHVAQNHILRAVENSKNLTIPTLLATLGAVIAGSQSNDDTAIAAMMAGTAFLQQQQINYTRSNEYEADRIGIQTLVKAGHDPEAMATIFEKFQALSRVYDKRYQMPDMLRTHPVSTTRIAEARNRAQNEKPSRITHRDPLPFEIFRQRVRLLSEDSVAKLRQHYDLALRESPDDPALLYGQALVYMEEAHYDRAQRVLSTLVAENPQIVAFQLALAESQMFMGQHADALELYAALEDLRPGNVAIGMAYADALLGLGSHKQAALAEEILRGLTREHAENVVIWERYAHAAKLAGSDVRAGEAFAEVQVLHGRLYRALRQLTLLSRRPDLGFITRERIAARIAELKPEIEKREELFGRQPDEYEAGLTLY